MGYRVHICEEYETVSKMQGGAFIGYDIKVRFSPNQRIWFNLRSYDLAKWLNENCDCLPIDSEAAEWNIDRSCLARINPKAYENPPDYVSPEEMKEFISECIRCGEVNGFVHLEWW